jgi:hypothetical protein
MIYFSPTNGVNSCEKENFIASSFRWNVFSQPLEMKSLKWIFFMFSGVTLITFFSLLMVGHFTPMGINSNDFFQPQWGKLQVFFFCHQWGVTSNDFFFTSNEGSL